MDSTNIVCPVCTLYLRPGITLKAHLTSHPKQKVIEALVSLTNSKTEDKEVAVPSTTAPEETADLPRDVPSGPQNWSQPVSGFSPMQGNHSFIYQQFMSTTSQQPSNVVNVNPLTQQYITIPTVFNPQVMCQPYMYHQQQQVIMSAATSVPSPIFRKPQIIDLCETDNANSDPQQTEDDATTPLEVDGCNSSEKNKIEKQDLLPKEQQVSPESDDIDSVTESVADEFPKLDDMENPKEEEVDLDYAAPPEFPVGSPTSSEGSDYIRIRSDLNKACQTQHINQTNGESDNVDEQESLSNFDNKSEEPEVQNSVPLRSSFEENNLHYSSNILQPNDQVIDMDGMQLVLCNDFMGSQLISQVEDFECINNRSERTVLMNIGGMDGGPSDTYNGEDHMEEESVSRESTNISIRADEPMPPRGELSGQESNGAASDIAWTRMHYESNSLTSTSYDLLARDQWDGSDSSDAEVPPLQSRVPPCTLYNGDADDTPTIVSVTEPPLNFKCSICGLGFKCPKERRVHQAEVHSKKNEEKKGANNVVGYRVVGKKPIKKLIIKPKRSTEIKSENNFDSVFVGMLNTESHPTDDNQQAETERASVIATVNTEYDIDDKKDVKFSADGIGVSLPESRKKTKLIKTYTKTSFKCDTCGETAKNESSYNEHLRIHPLECNLCGKYFYRRPNLQLHLKRHLGIKPYSCEFCQKSFLTKQKLDEHKNVHTGEAPIKCNMCNETFRRHSNLVQHRNRHHLHLKKKVKDYICYCGEILHSKKKLAWHKEIHDAKPKACLHCNEKFVHMASLTRHMRHAHNERFVPIEDRNNENVECPICKGVYLKSSLEVHIRNHSGQRPFTCSVCNKDFTTKWNLKLHKWTHAARATKPYKCDQCNGAFIRETDYVAHMNSHKSVRPYTCNHCGAQFIRKYNCQRHVKEHEKAKTFSCQVCGKSFHRSYYLKDHMRVHSGVRPFSCHVCGKTSTTKSNHNKHVMIHHAKEPVSTEN